MSLETKRSRSQCPEIKYQENRTLTNQVCKYLHNIYYAWLSKNRPVNSIPVAMLDLDEGDR